MALRAHLENSGDFMKHTNLPWIGIYHCYCGGGKLHDTIALSEPAPTCTGLPWVN